MVPITQVQAVRSTSPLPSPSPDGVSASSPQAAPISANTASMATRPSHLLLFIHSPFSDNTSRYRDDDQCGRRNLRILRSFLTTCVVLGKNFLRDLLHAAALVHGFLLDMTECVP